MDEWDEVDDLPEAATDSDRQNSLADVVELSQLLYALRGVEVEASRLLSESVRIASARGVTQAVIAEGAAVSPGRVSQIVAGGEARVLSARTIHREVYELLEWPGDAIKNAREGFEGSMTYPPYARRRDARPDDARDQ